jgi:hypothetical protein
MRVFTRTYASRYCLLLILCLSASFPGAGTFAASTGDFVNEDEFQNPPLPARPGAFWPWLNGHVSLVRITYELEEMKAKGMSGAEIWDVASHADPDKMLPAGPAFLGPESLDAIAYTVKEADRLGLKLGMIAASGWNAGGSWVAPGDAGMGLYHSEVTVEGPTRVSQVLPFPQVPEACPKDQSGLPLFWKEVAVLAMPAASAQTAVPLQSIKDLRNLLNASGQLTWDAPPGKWTILRLIMANTGHPLVIPSPNSKGPMIDFLNPDATRNHFQYIVDRLESKIGNLQNSPLKYLEVDSMELGEGVPWTERILVDFRRQHGYDPLRFLPVLEGRTVGSQDISQRFLYDWRKTVSDVFIESHYRTGRRLLNQHGLGLCAEAGGPGGPIWDSCPVESLKALGAVDVLRGEFWPKHRNIWLVKEISSAAHIYGKRIVDAESFTSWRHWQDGPYYLKQLADNALGEGLNHFTFHTFTHSPAEAGLPGAEYHAGTHINPNIVWWPMARSFIDYLARCSLLLQKGLFVADVCYYYGDQAPNFVPSKHAGFSPGPGYDYDVINSDVILNRLTVREHRLVLPDGMSYAMLVLPERSDMDLAVLRRLEVLVRAGATVIGAKPTRTGTLAGYPERDTQVARLANKLWGACDGINVKENKCGKGRVLCNVPVEEALASAGLQRDFSYRGADGRTRLDYVHRRTAAEEIYFVSNQNERWEPVECLFRVTGRQPQLWHPETGAVRSLAVYEDTGTATRVSLHLAPAESVFVVFREAASPVHWTRLETLRPSVGIKPALMPHSATPGGPMWLSDGRTSASEQCIAFDLGGTRKLEKIRVWNYNENVRGYINYGIKDFDILVSPNNAEYKTCGSFVLRDGTETEDKNYFQDLDVTADQVRYIRFAVKTNHNRPGYLEGISRRVGLSRVEFFGAEKIPAVRVHGVSSGVAFDPATDDDVGSLHPAAELISRGQAHVLRAWEPGTFVLRTRSGSFQQIEVKSIPAAMNFSGPWTLQFPPGRGAPETSRFEHLVSWTDHPEEGIKYFSGIVAYHKTFEIPQSLVGGPSHLELDLGVVQHVARVSLNGKPLATLWKPPYTVDITEAVRSGANELAVEVANTWNNRLVGDAAAPEGQRITKTNLQKKFSPNLQKLQPSGLIGPVRILFSEELPITPER